MTEQTQKKFSRRDALKILGTVAGATALANLPSKWSTPELASGVLPAHAQTSTCEWSLKIEVISVNTTLLVQNNSIPETTRVGNGATGSVWYWECQTGCIYLRLIVPTTGGVANGTVQIATRTNQFDLVFTTADNFIELLVNLGTGDYSTSPNNPVAGCEWPPR